MLEQRVTKWVSTEGRPAWADSDVAAYRIWQEFDGRRWFQRHEWLMRDGSTGMDEWIDGASGWCVDAQPVTTEAAA